MNRVEVRRDLLELLAELDGDEPAEEAGLTEDVDVDAVREDLRRLLEELGGEADA